MSTTATARLFHEHLPTAHEEAVLDEMHVGDIRGAFGTYTQAGQNYGTALLWTLLLLVIAIVGTTVAPWLLFFQQSYVIDKRITPRFTKSVLFPSITGTQILGGLEIGGVLAFEHGALDRSQRDTWRMPPLSQLEPMRLTALNRVWLIVLRAYLILAVGLLVFRVAQIALHRT